MLSREAIALLSPSSFWVPRYICQSAWIEHAPFAFWLTDALRPKRFVELGSHYGYSYFAFCQAIECLGIGTAAYAVDTWQGDEHAGFYDNSVYEAVLAINQRYAGFSRLNRATFEEAAAYFNDGSIDLIHIDGRHFYDDVKQDYESWLPKLTKDAIVLFHDTNVRERGFGVWKFFEELSARHPSFQFNHGNGLGVLALGSIPEGLAALFEAEGAEADQIRLIYASLGGSLMQRRQLMAKTDAIAVVLKDGADVSVDAAESLARIADWDPQLQHIRAELERYKSTVLQLQQDNAKLQAGLRERDEELKALRTAPTPKSATDLAEDVRVMLAEMVIQERRHVRTLSQEHARVFQGLAEEHARVSNELTAVHNSTSWKMTSPLRRVLARTPTGRIIARRVVKAIYWTATGQLVKRLTARRRALQLLQAADTQSPNVVKSLDSATSATPPEAARAIEIDYSAAVPFSFAQVPDVREIRVAAIVHLYYEELAGEFRTYLSNVPGALDVYVSTVDSFRASIIRQAFGGWSKGTVEVRVVPNRGRDIAPKLVGFRDIYDRYAYVLHLHGKRSHHASVLAPWRQFLLENLLGTREVVTSVLHAFEQNPKLGIVASQHFEPMRHWVNWGGNFPVADKLAKRIGFALNEQDPLDFPSGSMFWARTAALRPLLDLNLKTEDFDEESNQTDATLAHSIERIFFHACEHAGFDWIKIARPELFEHTPAVIGTLRPSDLEAYFNRYLFRLLDPRGTQPRTIRPLPVQKPAARLFDHVRNRALGLHIDVNPDTRVVIGLVTYNNSAEELRVAIGAAQASLNAVGLCTSGALFLLDNGVSTEECTQGNAFVTRFASKGNIGFGAGHNHLMRAAFASGCDIYIAVNPDGALHPDAVHALVQTVQAADGRALVEALQFPVEHPKPYDENSLDTPWVSGACLAISKAAFEDLGGFDEDFFMYCEDVDLSWRARAHGYALKTCPRALFLHAVTNREMKSTTLKMIFDSGVTLARKWGAPEFEQWLRSELAARGFPVPISSPMMVPEEWRRFGDFSNHFTFAQPRW